MADPNKEGKFKDARSEYDLDVDRMINEGMAGGTVGKVYNKVQIEEARELPRNDEPFPDTSEARYDDEQFQHLKE